MTRESTLQPFSAGDVFVGAAVLNDATDDHAADGRIVQFDADLNLKGELWLEGTRYLTFNPKFDHDGVLWVFDPRPHVVVKVGPDGRQLPVNAIAERPFSHVNFGRDGHIYLGEHYIGGREAIDPETGFLKNTTTKPTFLPGTDIMGEGKVFRYDADLNLIDEYDVRANGGMTGYLGVTTSVLSADEKTLLHVSETGRRVQRYDLEAHAPLPDLVEFDTSPEQMVFGLTRLADGDVMITHAGGLERIAYPSGEMLRGYPLEGFGWASVTPSIDGRSVYAGNFFTGGVARVDLESGEVLATADTGGQKSLAGLVQFAG